MHVTNVLQLLDAQSASSSGVTDSDTKHNLGYSQRRRPNLSHFDPVCIGSVITTSGESLFVNSSRPNCTFTFTKVRSNYFDLGSYGVDHTHTDLHTG